MNTQSGASQRGGVSHGIPQLLQVLKLTTAATHGAFAGSGNVTNGGRSNDHLQQCHKHLLWAGTVQCPSHPCTSHLWHWDLALSPTLRNDQILKRDGGHVEPHHRSHMCFKRDIRLSKFRAFLPPFLPPSPPSG
jgi:hypothetical protein